MKSKEEMLQFLDQLENREIRLKGKYPTNGEKVMFANIRVVIKEFFKFAEYNSEATVLDKEDA